MFPPLLRTRSVRLAGAVMLTATAVAATVQWATAADHRDSAALTASPAQDIADVYVFESPENPANTVFALTVAGLIPPAEASTTFFDPEVLYQWKIDTSGDAVEDLVIQAYATGTGADQVMHFHGPATPGTTGPLNRILDTPEIAAVRVSTSGTPIIASSQGVRVFAGVRDDPFFFDLGAFNEIIAGRATSFNNPGTDAFAGTNVLALVIEVPTSSLGSNAQLGVWATTNRGT